MIKHQTQPTAFTCAHTVLAMILEEPVSETIERVGHTEKGLPNQVFDEQLTRVGISFNYLQRSTITHEAWYVMTVPSLNELGRNHCVLVEFVRETRGDPRTPFTTRVFDPNKGNDACYYASSTDGAEDAREFHLTTWTEAMILGIFDLSKFDD